METQDNGANKGKNDIIEKLIKKFEVYLKFSKDKLKITDIFNSFENSAHSDLQTLIKLSNDRYKAMKSGGTLSKIIEKQEPLLTYLAHTAMDETIYHSNDIYNQKKIFKNLLNSNSVAQELINIRQKLMEKKPDPYAIAAEEKKKQEREQEDKKLYTSNRQIEKSSNLSPIDKRTKEKTLKKSSPVVPLEEKKETKMIDFEKFIERDSTLFQTQITNYKNYIDYIRNKSASAVEGGEMEEVDKEKEEEILNNKKFNINIDNLNSLKFQAKVYFAPPEPKKEDDVVDVNKLLNINKTKMLSYLQLQKLNDLRDINNTEKFMNLDNNESSLKMGEMSGMSEQSQIQKMKENLSGGGINASSRFTDIQHKSMEMREKILEYLKQPQNENINSIKYVKNEIFKNFDLEDNFHKKDNKVTGIIGGVKLPKIEDYDKIVARHLTSKKINKQSNNAKKSENDKDENGDGNKMDENQGKIEKEIKRLAAKKNKVKDKKIRVQSYTDQYSARDVNLNDSLAEVNRYLGKKNMDRYSLNKKIEELVGIYSKNNKKKMEEAAKKASIITESSSKVNGALATELGTKKKMSNQINFDKQIEEDPAYSYNIDLEPKRQKVERRLSKIQEEEKKKKDFELFSDFKRRVTEKQAIPVMLETNESLTNFDSLRGTGELATKNAEINQRNQERHVNLKSPQESSEVKEKKEGKKIESKTMQKFNVSVIEKEDDEKMNVSFSELSIKPNSKFHNI